MAASDVWTQASYSPVNRSNVRHRIPLGFTPAPFG